MGMKPRKKSERLRLKQTWTAEGWIERDEDTIESILNAGGFSNFDADQLVWDRPENCTEDWPPRKVKMTIDVRVTELPWDPPQEDDDED